MSGQNMCDVDISSPNLLLVCINKSSDSEIKGVIRHCYQEEPISFNSYLELMTKAEKFYDDIAFPQASQETRSFTQKKQQPYNKLRPQKTIDQRQLLEYRGEVATVAISVRFRQNAEWQGEATCLETGAKSSFKSMLAFTKFINNVVDKEV